jgi:hypothetical protein
MQLLEAKRKRWFAVWNCRSMLDAATEFEATLSPHAVAASVEVQR